MRKIFLILLLVGILVSPFFTLAKAPASNCETYCSNTSTYDPPAGKTCICNPLKAKTFEELVDRILNFLWGLALAITPLMIIIAGFYFITAAGDPQKIITAKKIVLYALIGLLIVASAKGLVAFLRKVIGG